MHLLPGAPARSRDCADLELRHADPHLAGARAALDDVHGVEHTGRGELPTDAVDVDVEAVRVAAEGGGGLLNDATWLKVGPVPWQLHERRTVDSGIHHRNVQLHMAYFPERGVANVALIEDGEVRLYKRAVAIPPQPGGYRLIVGSFVDSTEFSLALGDIRRIRVRGARLESSPEAAVSDRPAQRLAEHEPRAAIEALMHADPLPARAEMLRLFAFAELGDLAAVAAATPAVLAHIDAPRWFGDLALALRRHPLAAAALRGAAGPGLLPALRSIWDIALPHRNDRPMRDEILDGLQEIERLVPRTDAERAALRRLLGARGELWQRSGEAERARRDLEAAAALGPG